MLRNWIRGVVVAAAVATAGVATAQAAILSIGSVSLLADDFGVPYIDVENSTGGEFFDFYRDTAAFVGTTLTFADDANLSQNVDQATLGDILPGQGVQFLGFGPTFVVPPNQQAFAALSLALQFTNGGTPAGRLIIDLLDVSGAADCTQPGAICATVAILYETAPGEVPIPEPATWLLLGGGLAAAAARRRRR